ncbi:Protein disulfide-isomerase [Tolypocladium ophioglossoides CBS 100239]|uniref:Protein disulfide-isomerase n=1 Tax=Tolypocladium ophioglossoides (strain CBS 100239) TaxID=1163406 RepID=A0A0L0NJN4_TOLOC|nr:Protein disulfide-isomerase [Tolypocladium ophioglossoides CBS 100239]
MTFLSSIAVGLLAFHAAAWKHSDASELKQQLLQNDCTLVASLLSEWQTIRGDATLMSVDCSASRDLCAELDVVSFPAIRLYQRDRPMIRYRGPRKASSITSFLKRIQHPIITRLTNETLDSFASTDSVVFVAHLHDDDASLLARFSSIAAAYRDRYTFAVAQGMGILTGPSTLQCHNNVDGEEHFQTGLDPVGALEAFVGTCTEPLIPELNRRTELKYRQTGKSLVHYFSDAEADREAYGKAMKPLARAYREYLQFVTVDSSEYPEMPRTLGVAAGRGLAVENPHTGQAFPYRRSRGDSSALTAAEVGEFIASISRGNVEPWNGGSSSGTVQDVAAAHDEL